MNEIVIDMQIIVGSKETNQNHPYFYTGTSSQQNAIPEVDSSISELLDENSSTLFDDVT